MKKILKQLTPPALVSLIQKLQKPKETRLRFTTFQEAAIRCQNNAYQNDELVKVVVEKNVLLKEKLDQEPIFDLASLRTLIALGASRKSDKLNVIDFGGGGGYHYTLSNIALGPNNHISWNVVETPMMSKEAKRLENEKLKFFDNIADAKNSLGDVDLVFTSSALQYCPNPLRFLQDLVEINAHHLFITRTPFIEGYNELITIQASQISSNGPGPLPSGFTDRTITYPITYVSRKAVEEILKKKYDIRFMTDEGEGVFGLNGEMVTMNGYFCVRKDQ
jgi:putative methyltransferase (TIGR04325 family)